MGKFATVCSQKAWCDAGVMALCVGGCGGLHVDDAKVHEAGVMVPQVVVQDIAMAGRVWLANVPRYVLTKFSREILATEINVCLKDKKTIDLKSLFETLLAHIQFLPIATLSPNLRKCLCLFIKWIYAGAALPQ